VVKTVRLTEVLGRFIKDNSHLIILAAFLLLAVAISSAQGIRMATGIETMVATNTQLYKDIDYYNHHFNATSAQNTFLILITTDNVYDPQVLDAMGRLSKVLSSVKKITSVSGIQDYVAAGPTGTQGNMAMVEQLVTQLPPELVQPMVIDRHHSLMYVTMQGNVQESEKPAILEDVKSAIRSTPVPPGTSAWVTGTTARMLEIEKEMLNNTSVMLLTAVVLMVLALWLTFSHARWRLLPLPIVLIGVVYTAGIMSRIDVPLTMVSMAVFPILIGLGVEYAIQFHNRMMEELGSGREAGEAVVATVRGIGPPVLYSVTCTCLGFASILISPVPMVYDFGLMCLVGVIVCFLTALFLLMAILYLLARRGHITVKKEQKSSFIERAIERVAETTTRHPEVIVIATIAMLAGYALDPSVGVEVDSSTFVPQDLPSVTEFRSLNYAQGVKAGDMMVVVKGPDVTRPDVIRWMRDFSSLELENNPDVLAANSLATLLEASNNGTLPSTDAGMQQAIAALPPDELNRYVDDYHSTAVILMNINMADTPHLMSMLRRVEKDLKFMWPPAGVTASLSGEQMVTLTTMSSLTGDRLKMTLESGLLVLIGLLIIYKGDWIRAVVPTFAVIIVTGLSCIVMVLLGMKYTPLSTTLGSLTIGIGVDFSILHMSRYYEEKAKGYSPKDAMRIATGKIGSAIFCSASTVIAGFGALVASNFSILSNFGIVTIIDFVMALCSAFMIMPPLLVTLDTWGMKRTNSREAVIPAA
jgi:hydrophobe/amphiphile efflux-3 (HAE3) family protein